MNRSSTDRGIVRLHTLIVFVLVLFSGAVTAGTRCECEAANWLGDCTAKVERNNNWVRITSSTLQCSRVDWYIDAQPHLTIVVDGAESEELLLIPPNAKLIIQSCKVCKDAAMPAGSNSSRINSSQRERFRVNGYWCGGGSKEYWEFNSNGIGTIDGSSARIAWRSDKVFTLTVFGADRDFTFIDENTMSYSALFFKQTAKRCG